MNQQTLKSLDRMLDRLERRSGRPRGRFSTAPLVLGLGLGLGHLLLSRLVPVVWDSLLPRGLDQAWTFRGWPGLVWRSALFCRANHDRLWIAVGAAVVFGLLACALVRPLRYVVWLSALAVIVADAGILVVMLQTSLSATLDGAGF